MIQFVQVTIVPEEFSMASKKLLTLKVKVEAYREVKEFAITFDPPYFESQFDLMMKEAARQIKAHFRP